jgi:hypothetical protein
MKLENWSVTCRWDQPYIAPELKTCLQGLVYGHPEFPDGETVTTSIIKEVTVEGHIVTKSGSTYELGEVDPAYELAYPNARQRLLTCGVTNESN